MRTHLRRWLSCVCVLCTLIRSTVNQNVDQAEKSPGASGFAELQVSGNVIENYHRCADSSTVRKDSYYESLCWGKEDEDSTNPDGVPDPSRSFLQPGGLSNVSYLGIATHVTVNLRDSKGREVRNCGVSSDWHISASPPLHAETAFRMLVTCQRGRSALVVCLVSMQPTVELSVAFRGTPLQPLPMTFLPTHRALHGCARPGVSALLSPCGLYPQPLGRVERSNDSENRRTGDGEAAREEGKELWEAALAFGSGGRSEEGGTSTEEVTENVMAVTNLCFWNRSLLFFVPPPDTYRAGYGGAGLVLDAHAWGQVVKGMVNVPVRVLSTSIDAFAATHGVTVNNGDAGDGAGDVYIAGEGPTTHFGHMLMDLVLPLFTVAQLLDDRRTRKQVVLWPSYSFECPAKGPTVHSRRFWDLFRTLTVAPFHDVTFLAQWDNRPHCFRNAALGSMLDHRVGYWIHYENQRTLPFQEDWAEAVAVLRQNYHLHPLGLELWQGASQGTTLQGSLVVRDTRRIVNEEAVMTAAEKAGFHMKRVDWSAMSLREQLHVMAEGHLLIGMHGTGLDNVAFSRQGSGLLDLLPYCFSNATDFWELSCAMRVRHYTWRNLDPAAASCPPSQPACGIPDCGFDPPQHKFIMGGGVPNVQLQDTVVDTAAVTALLAHLHAQIRLVTGALPTGGCVRRVRSPSGKEARSRTWSVPTRSRSRMFEKPPPQAMQWLQVRRTHAPRENEHASET